MGLSIHYNYGFSSIPGSGTAADPYVLSNPTVSNDTFGVYFLVDNGPNPASVIYGTLHWSFTGDAYSYLDLNFDPPVYYNSWLSLGGAYWESGSYDSNNPESIPISIEFNGLTIPFKQGSITATSPGFSPQPDNYAIQFIRNGSDDYGVTNGSLWSNFTGLVWFVPDSQESALDVEIQPSGVVSGVSLSTQPVIKIVDQNGNVVTTASNPVSVTANVVNGSGSLSGTTMISAVNGYATFTDLTFTGDASFYLTFTATGLTPVDSDEIATLTPVSILVDTQPVAGLSGDQFLTQPVVKVVNWLDEVVPTYSDDVVCTLVVVSGSPVLTGTTSVTPSSGYATYTDLVVTGSGSFYLHFTSGSLVQANSNTIYMLPDPGNPNPPIPVKPKRSYIPLSVPTANDMEINEFAINVVDKKGYVCDSNGVVHQVFDGSQGVSSIIAGTGISVNNSTGNVTISTIASSPSLEQLTDVQITNKLDGQVLRYFALGQKWVNSNTIDGGNF